MRIQAIDRSGAHDDILAAVGAETSKTRDTLLDCVEKMMLEDGYASVTYRALATRAGSHQAWFSTTSQASTTSSLLRSSATRNAISAPSPRPGASHRGHAARGVGVSWEEANGALITEFMALGNHRKSIRD